MTIRCVNAMSLEDYRTTVGIEPAPLAYKISAGMSVEPLRQGRPGSDRQHSCVSDVAPDRGHHRGSLNQRLADLIRPCVFHGRTGPEDRLSHDVAVMLADEALSGRLHALPVRSLTEYRRGGRRVNGVFADARQENVSRLAAIQQALSSWLGAWPGQPDYPFVPIPGLPHPTIVCRGGLLELKRPAGDQLGLPDIRAPAARGELSPRQRELRDLATLLGMPWAVGRSLDEVMATLESWGVLE